MSEALAQSQTLAQSPLAVPTMTDAIELPPPLPLSAAAEKLRAYLNPAVWQELLAAGLPMDQDFFWIRLDSLRSRHSAIPEPGGGGFLKNASEKLSKLAESASLKTNRFLIYGGDEQFYVTTQMAASGHAWKIQRNRYTLSNRWSGWALEVVLESAQDDVDVQSASCRFELVKPFATPYFGSPTSFISSAQIGRVSLTGDDCSPFPLSVRQSHARKDAFTHPIDSKGMLAWISISQNGLSLLHGDQQQTIDYANIVAWHASGDGISLLESSDAGIRRLVIAKHASVEIRDAAEAITAIANPLSKSEADVKTDQQTVPVDANATANDEALDLDWQQPELSVDTESECLISRSLQLVISALDQSCGDVRCQTLLLAAEFAVTPLFGALPARVVAVLRDEICTVYAGEGRYDSLQAQSVATPISLAGTRFFSLQPAGNYRVDFSDHDAAVFQALQVAFGSCADPLDAAGSVVLLSTKETQAELLGQSVPSGPLAWLMRLGVDGTLTLMPADGSDEIAVSTGAVARKATTWTAEYGTVSIRLAEDSAARTLTAAAATLIAIWQTKALTALKKRTQGVSLGEIYNEFNRSRQIQFLAGVYGNYFLTHQRLAGPRRWRAQGR